MIDTTHELDRLLDIIEQKNFILPQAQIGSTKGKVKDLFKEESRQARIDENMIMIRTAQESGDPTEAIELGTLIDECNKRIKKLGGLV